MSTEELASLTLLDADERPIVLGELWAQRPVILVWLRHFG